MALTIPNTDEFAEILRSVELGYNYLNGEHIEIGKVHIHSKFKEQYDAIIETVGVGVSQGPTIFHQKPNTIPVEAPVCVSKETKIKPESLIKKIKDDLTALGIYADEHIPLLLLAYFSFDKNKDSNPVETFNALMALNVKAGVKLYQISNNPNMQPGMAFKYPPFEFGEIDIKKLKYRCMKANRKILGGGSFWELHGHTLSGKWAIEQDQIEVKILNIHDICHQVCSSYPIGRIPFQVELVLDGLSDEFMTRFSFPMYIDFWEEFRKFQYIFAGTKGPAIGSIYFSQLFEMFLSVFSPFSTKKGPMGYVNPLPKLLLIPEFALEYKQHLKKLEETYKYNPNDTSPFRNFIDQICKYAYRAIEHSEIGNYDDAYLSLCIALEIALSDGKNIASSISKRTAILVGTTLNSFDGFKESVKKIDTLYGIRSKYVHHGKSVEVESLEELKDIVCEVIFSLLRVASEGKAEGNEFKKNWHAHLDFVFASFETGRDVTKEDLLKCGIGLEK